jgi:hypothetical protein
MLQMPWTFAVVFISIAVRAPGPCSFPQPHRHTSARPSARPMRMLLALLPAYARTDGAARCAEAGASSAPALRGRRAGWPL